MSYGDFTATVGIIVAILAAIFAYVLVPDEKRAEGWAIFGWLIITALTIKCVWQLWLFVSATGVPTRYDILQTVVYTIGAMGGWGTLLGLFFHWNARRLQR